MFTKKNIHGINVNCSDYTTALAEVEQLVDNGKHSYVCFPDSNLFMLAMRNPDLKDILNRADLTYPDGLSVQKMLKIRYGKCGERVTGPTFMLMAAEHGIPRHWKHFFYGGTPEVVEKLVDQLQKKFPGIEIVGHYSPPFRPLSEEETAEVKRQIESSGADLLWVALGGGKQDRWMAENFDRIDVPVMLGVGAAFDFHSGNRAWAPKWIRDMGLEWLFRLFFGGWKTTCRNIHCVSSAAWILTKDLVAYRLLGKGSRECEKSD